MANVRTVDMVLIVCAVVLMLLITAKVVSFSFLSDHQLVAMTFIMMATLFIRMIIFAP